jgi:hypothetical protein
MKFYNIGNLKNQMLANALLQPSLRFLAHASNAETGQLRIKFGEDEKVIYFSVCDG